MFNLFKTNKEPVNYFFNTKEKIISDWFSFHYPAGFMEEDEHDPSDNSILYQFYSNDSDNKPVIQISDFALDGEEYNQKEEKEKLEHIFNLNSSITTISQLNFIIGEKITEGRIVHYVVVGKKNRKAIATIIYPQSTKRENANFVTDFLKGIKLI
jgi:hypothetical protein